MSSDPKPDFVRILVEKGPASFRYVRTEYRPGHPLAEFRTVPDKAQSSVYSQERASEILALISPILKTSTEPADFAEWVEEPEAQSK